jgi:hypothetical protein
MTARYIRFLIEPATIVDQDTSDNPVTPYFAARIVFLG